MADAATQRHTDEAVDALMTLLKYAAWQMAVKDDQIKTLQTLLNQCEREVGRLSVVVRAIPQQAVSLSPNGTQSFDAVGKPTNDASGGTIRVEESSSSTVNRSAPSASAGANLKKETTEI